MVINGIDILNLIKNIRKIMSVYNTEFPHLCCFETSVIFQMILKKHGISCDLIEGYWNCLEHYWNRVNDIIIDITLDQFEKHKYGLIDVDYFLEWYKEKKIHIYDNTTIGDYYYNMSEKDYEKIIIEIEQLS